MTDQRCHYRIVSGDDFPHPLSLPYLFVRQIGSTLFEPIKFSPYSPEKLFIGSTRGTANLTDKDGVILPRDHLLFSLTPKDMEKGRAEYPAEVEDGKYSRVVVWPVNLSLSVSGP